MQRVMILGQPGSGKSTLAQKLGACTGLPVFHIDNIHWSPGWVERPSDEKTASAQRSTRARNGSSRAAIPPLGPSDWRGPIR